MNLRLIRASNYLQRFEFIIRYKSNKQYIISNILLRLKSSYMNSAASDIRELNTLITNPATNDIRELNALIASYYIAILIEIFKEFRQKLTIKYASDPTYRYIIKILNNNENVVKLSFL